MGPCRVDCSSVAESLPANFSLARCTQSLFAELQRDLRDRWLVQAGARIDDIEGYGTRRNWRAAACYALREIVSVLTAKIGTGFAHLAFSPSAIPYW